jgi:uncharacterized protein
LDLHDISSQKISTFKKKRMKPFLLYSFVLLSLASFSQSNQFDKALADSLGADQYGMKSYILVILKTGANTTTDKEKLQTLFKGHMNNINRLADAGKLVVAGPLKKNALSYRGIFVLNVKTIEEAKGLLETDPAIKEKVFDVEILEWYGSAALPMYLPVHKKIERVQP